MVEILIKSFNRPYYLERCLTSIYNNVVGEFVIKVLDDGTPSHYLQKIAKAFPDVQIFTSPLYNEKCAAIEKHLNGYQKFSLWDIPTNFWIRHVENTSQFFLLLEDDIWLYDKLELQAIVHTMASHKLVMLKIYWQGNQTLNCGKLMPINPLVEQIHPRIPLKSRIALEANFKIKSILSRLRLINFDYSCYLPFYSMYTVASVFFDKDYWLYLWQGAGSKIDEPVQLRKALNWYKERGCGYGKLMTEIARTSYITSATNRYPDIEFDLFHFNHQINEAWFQGLLNASENYPNDYSRSYLSSFLNTDTNIKCRPEKWGEWIRRFKKTYADMGCVVD